MANRTMLRRQVENFTEIRRDPRFILKESEYGEDIPPDQELFMCPLCLKIWSLETELEDISREHVPPQKLGGRSRCITCKDCNSKHGNSVDNGLIQRINFDATMSGLHPSIGYGVQLKTESGKFANMNFYQGENPRWRLLYKEPDKDSEKHLEQIGQEIFRPYSKFNTVFRYPSDRRRNIGLLRIAYLEAFCSLGYGFLCHEGAEGIVAVRSQLTYPDETIFPVHFATGRENLSEESIGVNIVIDPFPLRSLFVVFDLDYQGYNERYGVFLPGLRSDWHKTFSILNNAKETHDEFRFGLVPCNPDNLDYQEHPWLAQEMWDRVFPKA